MIILLISAILIWKYVLGRGFESPEHETAVYILLIYFIIWSFCQILLNTYKARREIAKAQIPMFFETLCRVIATAYVVFNNLGIIALAYTYVIGEIAVLITSIFLFKGYKIKKPRVDYIKSYIKFAFPIAIVIASTKIMTDLDKVLIQLFWNATEGGNYFAVFRLSRFLDMATMSIGVLLFPTMSALHSKKDIKSIKKLSYLSERYLSMIIFPIVFFMIFLAEPVVHIMLSDKLYPAIPILQILPIFALFDALDRPYQMKLLGMDLPHFTRNRILIMVLVNVILNIMLIPKDIQLLKIDLAGMGGVGAAIATVIAYFIGLVYTRIKVWQISKIKINLKIIFHMIGALIMGIFLYYLNIIYPISRWYDLLGFIFLGLGVYLLVLFIFQEIKKEDINFFIDTLNIKKMIKYIMDEIKRN
jgi:O-antigen/teichoic acid export membrane protein